MNGQCFRCDVGDKSTPGRFTAINNIITVPEADFLLLFLLITSTIRSYTLNHYQVVNSATDASLGLSTWFPTIKPHSCLPLLSHSSFCSVYYISRLAVKYFIISQTPIIFNTLSIQILVIFISQILVNITAVSRHKDRQKPVCVCLFAAGS